MFRMGFTGLYISHLFFLNIDGECMRTYYIILYKFSRLNFFQLNLKKVNNWYVACNRHLITIILILIKLKNLTELTKSIIIFLLVHTYIFQQIFAEYVLFSRKALHQLTWRMKS